MTLSTARSRGFTFGVASIVSLALGAAAKAGDTQISGFTQRWIGGETYDPLPGVKVDVYRNGNLVGSTTSRGQKATYAITIRSGEPIQIIYHLSNNEEPMVQNFSAQDGTFNNVNIALIDKRHYAQLEADGRVPPASTTRAYISAIIRRDDSGPSNEIREQIQGGPR